ncbi:MAG: M24 family metallopeptidase [Hyphomicrobiales bacterium]
MAERSRRRSAPAATGDYCAFVPMLPRVDATAPHLTWDDRPFNDNEGTFELGGCYRRYHAPLSRTVYLGKPPQKFLDAESAVLEATEAGAREVFGAHLRRGGGGLLRTLQKRGLPQGSARRLPDRPVPPAGLGERTPSIRRGQDGARAHMTLHFRACAVVLDDGGLELSETILITPSGVECRRRRAKAGHQEPRSRHG